MSSFKIQIQIREISGSISCGTRRVRCPVPAPCHAIVGPRADRAPRADRVASTGLHWSSYIECIDWFTLLVLSLDCRKAIVLLFERA